MKNLRIATVKSGRPEDNNLRVKLVLRHDTDGAFRWYGQETPGSDTYADCELSGSTMPAALNLAERAWAGSAWDLRAAWLKQPSRK